jgi:hypothetical protein
MSVSGMKCTNMTIQSMVLFERETGQCLQIIAISTTTNDLRFDAYLSDQTWYLAATAT